MNVTEVGKVQAFEAPVETPGGSPLRTNERNEVVAGIRAAIRAGGVPEEAQDLLRTNGELQIAFDRESRQYVVKILDRTTQEVVRQIPAEDVLSRARFFVQTSQRRTQEQLERNKE